MLSPLYPEIDKKIAALRKRLFKADQLRQPNLPSSLYHYTNAGGLLSILVSSRLWATNAYYLNDSLEIEHAANLVTTILEKEASKAKSKAVKKFIEKSSSNFNYFEGEDSFNYAYVVSFCEQGDLLSQWRGYGATGGGFAIGIKPDISIGNPVFSPDHHFIMLRKIVYDRAVQADILTTTISKIVKLFESLIGGVSPNHVDMIIARFSMFLRQELVIHMFTFKDPAFSEEQEWRLVSLADFEFPHFRDQLRFRAANKLLIPYYELNVSPLLANDKGKLSINDIVFGPTLHDVLTTQSLAMAVIKYGYDLSNMDIRASKVPLRF